MTYRWLNDLDKAVAASGLRIVLLDGWKTRGRPTSFQFDPKGIVAHHTGSPLEGRSACNILLAGRADLPAPLSQISLGRDGTVYIVAAGRANHAGEVITKGFMRRGDGNAQSIGIEAQNSGTEGWTDVQIDAYYRLCASIADYYGWSRANVLGHGEVSTSGKWDPGHRIDGKNVMINMTAFRFQVAAVSLSDQTPHVPLVASWKDPSSFVIGATGSAVTKLGERLVLWATALKLPAPYLEGPGPEFTATDRLAVAVFQHAQGWTGADADGYPGPETLRRLLLSPIVPPPATDKWVELVEISFNVAGYNKTQGTGETLEKPEIDARSIKRVPGIVKALLAYKADVINLQECSAAMLPFMDRGLVGYKRSPGKGRGRVIYVRADLPIKAGGVREVKSELQLPGQAKPDDKPYVWTYFLKENVGFVSVSGHTENQNGKDARTGRSADDIRVDQALEYVTGGEGICNHFKLPLTRLAVSMDGNSYDMVRLAALKHGYVSGAKVATKKVNEEYRTHNGWESTRRAPEPGSHFDLTLVLSNPGVKVDYCGIRLNHTISDHNIVRTIRRVKV